MANLFGQGGLLGPIAPGMSPAINPISMMGAGIYSGDIAGAMAQMGQMQQQAGQLELNRMQHQMLMEQAERERMETERERKERAAIAAMAPDLFPNNPALASFAGRAGPQTMAQLYLAQQKAGTPGTTAEKLYEAMGGQAGTGKTLSEWYATDFKPGGTTTVTVGGQSEFGSVPPAMARVDDPESPTGTRLVYEPGAPGARKEATSAKEKEAPLNALEDSMNRYRAVLERYGPEIVAGEGRSALDTAYTDLLMRQKDAYGLGALQQADLQLMERLMINPTGLTAQYYDMIGGGDALISQLDQMQATVDDARARLEGRSPGEQRGSAPQVGDVEGGYEYIGGPPGDPTSWRATQ